MPCPLDFCSVCMLITTHTTYMWTLVISHIPHPKVLITRRWNYNETGEQRNCDKMREEEKMGRRRRRGERNSWKKVGCRYCFHKTMKGGNNSTKRFDLGRKSVNLTTSIRCRRSASNKQHVKMSQTDFLTPKSENQRLCQPSGLHHFWEILEKSIIDPKRSKKAVESLQRCFKGVMW